MSAIRVMIVDDSAFSRTIIADALPAGDFEVVGEAEALEGLIDTYVKFKPDIVTMDIAMPGADGFECSKALLHHDRAAKIILVSSMKDEDTEAEAKRIGIAGYVQKPVDGETLLRIVKNVLAPDTLFGELEKVGIGVFKEALSQTVTRMTKTCASFEDKAWAETRKSQGITVVIGIIGRYPGSMLLDLSKETAAKMAKNILRREAKNQGEIVAMAAEFANVVGGIACSMINRTEKTYGLKVAPPSVFNGESEISSPNIKGQSAIAETEFGPIFLGVGFKKGSVLWM